MTGRDAAVSAGRHVGLAVRAGEIGEPDADQQRRGVGEEAVGGGEHPFGQVGRLAVVRIRRKLAAVDERVDQGDPLFGAPRLIAGITMMPLLVLTADIIGVFGGYVVSIFKLGFNPSTYINNTIEFMEPLDVISGLVKAAVFGLLVTLMGCYHGYHSRGGAQGVGTATTNAVVSASILILCFNYFITELFFAR